MAQTIMVVKVAVVVDPMCQAALLAVKAELADYVAVVVAVVAAVFPEQVASVEQVAAVTAWLSAGNSISSNAEIDLS